MSAAVWRRLDEPQLDCLLAIIPSTLTVISYIANYNNIVVIVVYNEETTTTLIFVVNIVLVT